MPARPLHIPMRMPIPGIDLLTGAGIAFAGRVDQDIVRPQLFVFVGTTEFHVDITFSWCSTRCAMCFPIPAVRIACWMCGAGHCEAFRGHDGVLRGYCVCIVLDTCERYFPVR